MTKQAEVQAFLKVPIPEVKKTHYILIFHVNTYLSLRFQRKSQKYDPRITWSPMSDSKPHELTIQVLENISTF